MRFRRPVLRAALDEGVPNAVGRAFAKAGHKVLYLNRILARGTTDQLVSAFAQLNDAILVATDNDMRQIARGHGVGNSRYRTLSLVKLSCSEVDAATRVVAAMSLIEHEWHVSATAAQRRIFIDIGPTVIRTYR